MLGKRSAHGGSVGADHPYLDHVGRDSFYGLLACQRDHLFRDEDFADLYCLTNGRPSVPPSLLATALLLQAYDGASDEEAKARADFDLRWKVALGVGLADRPFAKSTLQLFRAQLPSFRPNRPASDFEGGGNAGRGRHPVPAGARRAAVPAAPGRR